MDFLGCRFEHARLTGSRLHRVRFVDCGFRDSDLSGVILEECSFTRVEFRSCRLSGLQAAQTRFVDVGLLDSRVDGANFRMSSWQRAELAGCDLVDSDFYEATMPDSRLVRCNLSRVQLSKCQLAGSTLVGSTLDGIRGAASLRNVTIGSDQIVTAALAVFAALGITIDDDQ
jgi:uncharacterized protein YjbI with pentapeptide repeats